MSRRLFIGRIGALIGVGVAATAARARAPRKLELQRSHVAGFQYHDGMAVWPSLAVGDTLSLMREPDNAYDRRAVRVERQGRKLGYVPRADNAAVSHLLDAGQALHAEIVTLRSAENPWDRVEFSIALIEG